MVRLDRANMRPTATEKQKHELGTRLRQRRTTLGLKQTEVEAAFGFKFETYVTWERGDAWPAFPNLRAIEHRMGIRVLDIIADGAELAHPQAIEDALAPLRSEMADLRRQLAALTRPLEP